MQQRKKDESDKSQSVLRFRAFIPPIAKENTLAKLLEEADTKDKINITRVIYQGVTLVWLDVKGSDLGDSLVSKITHSKLHLKVLHGFEKLNTLVLHMFLLSENVFKILLPTIKIPESPVEKINDETINDRFVPSFPNALPKLKKILESINVEQSQAEGLLFFQTKTEKQKPVLNKRKNLLSFNSGDIIIKRVSYDDKELIKVKIHNEDLGRCLLNRLKGNKTMKYSLYAFEPPPVLGHTFLLPENILKDVAPDFVLPLEVSEHITIEDIKKEFYKYSSYSLIKIKTIIETKELFENAPEEIVEPAAKEPRRENKLSINFLCSN